MRNLLLTIVISTGLSWSCIDRKQFSDIPFLRYENEEWVSVPVEGVGSVDRLRVTLYMTDGDGNIGLRDDQVDPPYDPDSPFHFNLWIKYFEKQGDSLVEIPEAQFSARLPNLTPQGQNKTLEADIEYDLDLTQSAADSIQFSFILVDRDLQLSNEVFSPVLSASP